MKKLYKLAEDDALCFLRFSRQCGSHVAFLIIALCVITISWSPTTLAEPTAGDIESPVVLLERITAQVIKILRDDYELLQQEPERAHQIVKNYILPHLDDVIMTRLAVGGENWRKATRQQKRELVKEFRTLLIRTYSKLLVEFKDQEIKYFPTTVAADSKRTIVNAEVMQPGRPSIPIAYRMRIKNNAWKIFDIKIDGISLVTSYRGTFAQEIRRGGIDGLITFLRDKNSSKLVASKDLSINSILRLVNIASVCHAT